ncbi:hypothetical protein ACF0H5_009748 [Mactra antiquata]
MNIVDRSMDEFFIYWITIFILLFALLYRLPSVIKKLWEAYIMSNIPFHEFPGVKLPPGTMGYPLIGETLQFFKKGGEFYKEKVETYGFIYKTHLLGRPTIRVIGADNVKKILLSENVLVTHNWPTSARLLLGTGSISQSSGHVHKIRRKNMMHAFRLDEMDKMVPVMQDVIRSNLEEWKSKRDIYTYPQSKLMAFTVSACTLVGSDMTSLINSGMHDVFKQILDNIFSIPLDIPGFGFRKGMNAKRQLLSMLESILSDVDKRPYTPILKAHYESSSKLGMESIEEINEGVIDLLFAGHETITSVSTNCVMFLGKNKSVVEKLRDELRENNLLKHKGEEFTPLDLQTINNLKYLHCVMKEVLRLCPPAGGGFRKALQSFELGGYLIPKDWSIIVSIRETQHLSPLFKHSEMFDPDRWNDDKLDKGAERFHYLPFGMGARGCVGKTYAQIVIKVFIIELVRTCDWTLKNENIQMRYIPVPVASDYLPATFYDPALN